MRLEAIGPPALRIGELPFLITNSLLSFSSPGERIAVGTVCKWRESVLLRTRSQISNGQPALPDAGTEAVLRGQALQDDHDLQQAAEHSNHRRPGEFEARVGRRESKS